MPLKIKFSFIFLLLTGLQVFSQVPEEEEEEIINYQGEILDTTQTSYADRLTYAAEINMRGLVGTGEELPFWMYSNTRGRIYENTNVAGWATGKANYDINGVAFVEAGVGVLYQDGRNDQVILDEWYAHFENSWLRATVGKKQRELLYNGLSASNENIPWSLNAQPLPGIQIGTSRPLFLSPEERGIGFEASWNEYLLGEDRYMSNARLHHKNFHLLYRTANGFQVKAGVQHFAHWGGANEERGEIPITQGYLDAVTLQHPSQHHLSSYGIYLSKQFPAFRLELLYNHIATDLTGRRFGNTPDGRYGIFYKSVNMDKIINSVIYEFYYTQHQSYDSSSGQPDNYFNHFVYQTGWVHEEKIIGVPFMTYNPEEGRVVNNKFTAHHVGIGGQYSTLMNTYPYRLLLSFAHNDGIYSRRYRPKQNAFYGIFEAKVFQGFVDINVQLAAEFNNTASPKFGAGVHLKKQF